MKRQKSSSVAMGGVICALCVVVMLSGSIIPAATFCAPALAGALLMAVAVDAGMKQAWTCYGVVALVSLLFVPDKEMALFFVLLFGYYPLLKAYLQRLPGHVMPFCCKLAVFNLAVVAVYSLLLFVFPMPGLVEEFAESQPWMLAVLLVLGNVSFVIYDSALFHVVHLYVRRIRPRLRHRTH